MIAAYVRVSSSSQGTEMQTTAIRQLASSKGDTISEWYSESKSGRTLARPELDRLRAAVARGEVGRVYIFKLDRITRSGIRDTLQVIEEFRARGVELLSVADGFSLDGPAADVILSVLAWAAKMERLAIGERISAARERIEQEGGRWGRPPKTTPALRAKILELKASGRTVRSIAMAVGVSRATVGRVVSHKPAAGIGA